MSATNAIATPAAAGDWEQLARAYGPQREPSPPADGDRTCRFCRRAEGIRWVLPRGVAEEQRWLCELCAEAAQRVGRPPAPRPDPDGCRFEVSVTPGARAAFVRAWPELAEHRCLGYAVVYRAEAGDERAYRIDLSGAGLVGARHYSGDACLAEAIADAKLLLALRKDEG